MATLLCPTSFFAFSQVHVVRLKGTKKVYAMKTLNKWDMLKRREVGNFQQNVAFSHPELLFEELLFRHMALPRGCLG